MRLILSFLLMFSPILVSYSLANNISIADFANEDLDQWKSKSFDGVTHYSIMKESGRHILKAHADASASGLAKEMTIDLLKTPYINWSWKIDHYLPKMDETKKSGDDYAARLYVVKSGGFFIWKTKALNYVWSSNQNQGAIWDNAYAGSSARMLAVRGQSGPLKQWISEKRNVYEDMIRLFGDKGSQKDNQESYRYIDVVAIMTDTDDSKNKATAYYGDIYFSAQ